MRFHPSLCRTEGPECGIHTNQQNPFARASITCGPQPVPATPAPHYPRARRRPCFLVHPPSSKRTAAAREPFLTVLPPAARKTGKQKSAHSTESRKRTLPSSLFAVFHTPARPPAALCYRRTRRPQRCHTEKGDSAKSKKHNRVPIPKTGTSFTTFRPFLLPTEISGRLRHRRTRCNVTTSPKAPASSAYRKTSFCNSAVGAVSSTSLSGSSTNPIPESRTFFSSHVESMLWT